MAWWRVKTDRMETLVLADSETMARRKAIAFWAELGGDITDEMIVSAEPEIE